MFFCGLYKHVKGPRTSSRDVWGIVNTFNRRVEGIMSRNFVNSLECLSITDQTAANIMDFGPSVRACIPDNFIYNMSHKHRGVALVIYHRSFNVPGISLPVRQHFKKDFEKVKECFSELGFDVRKCKEKSLKEIKATLEKLRQEDHSSRDCLVIIVLTHGDDGILYAKDAGYKQELLWQPFTSENCTTLAGKPRLVFIQACRGDLWDGGIKLVHMEGEVPSKVFRHPVEEMEQVEEVEELHSKEEVEDNEVITTNPNYLFEVEGDFLVVYSSVPGHVSWKSNGIEAWFIEKLCQALKSPGNTKNHHLLTILTFVNREVALECESQNAVNPKQAGFKQVPCVYSNLRKFLYFS